MDAAAQAADILAPYIKPGMTLLDAGCGSGHYYWSFLKRHLNIEYFGLDYSPTLIEIGRKNIIGSGLNPDRLRVMAIEDLDETFDIVLCFNTLSLVRGLSPAPGPALPVGPVLYTDPYQSGPGNSDPLGNGRLSG